MKKIFKITSCILALAFFSIALSGCSHNDNKDPNVNKIIVWSFEDADAWKSVEKDFEKNNKGFDLIYYKQTLDSNYENKVINSILSDEGPDVWAMPNDWVYRHKGKLAPLPEKAASKLNLDDDFVPSIKQSIYLDDKIYALSPSSEPLMVYYNSKLFSDTLSALNQNTKDKDQRKRNTQLLNEVPKTWSDFTETTKLLTVKSGSNIERAGIAMGTANVTNSQNILYLLMMQNETSILSTDANIATFNLPESTSIGDNDNPGRRALEFYSSFANPSSVNYSWNDALGNDVEAFINGKVAMIFGFSDLKNTLTQKYPNFKYKKAFVPQVQSDATKITDFARFNAFGVSKYSNNVNIAWSAVYSLVFDAYSEFNSANNLYTSKKSKNYDISITSRSSSNPEKLSLATANSLVKGRYPVEFDQTIKKAIKAVNSGGQSAQLALDIAANTITELLRRETW